MPRLHLTVLTTRNETWRLWKRISKFQNSNFIPAIFTRLSILFTNYYRVFLTTQKYFFKLFVWYLLSNLHV